jgi:hypothetical protein
VKCGLGKIGITEMPVLVSGDQGMVYIDEIPIGAPTDIAAGGDAQPTAGGDDLTMSGARNSWWQSNAELHAVNFKVEYLSLRFEKHSSYETRWLNGYIKEWREALLLLMEISIKCGITCFNFKVES